MKRCPLAILTGAAMALPAFSATQPTETSLALKASAYDEGDISSNSFVAGSEERYDIDVYQFQLIKPVGTDWSVGVEASREIMSGASPWGTITGADGKPTLIMSGATIDDARTEVSVTGSRYYQDASFSIGITRSEEDDYESNAITVSTEKDFIGGMGTLALGISYASDDIEPTDAAAFGRVTREKKNSGSISAAWTQILNAKSLVQTGLSLTKHRGFLSDPYKLRDVRPDDRFEKAISVRYRRYVDRFGAALHVDYRYYRDDFDIRSHTLDLKWYQRVTDSFKLIPSIRYYSQQEASFYQVADDFSLPVSVAQSSDYRLSSFGAYSFGIKGVYSQNNWQVDLSLQRYISDGDYGFDDPDQEHPALLDFNLMTLGFGYRF
ncbi:MAG: hypothetical protein ACI8Z1_001405 [Candidatus Azotimanducaceae bacterium]|jgi:hypothetical protein